MIQIRVNRTRLKQGLPAISVRKGSNHVYYTKYFSVIEGAVVQKDDGRVLVEVSENKKVGT